MPKVNVPNRTIFCHDNLAVLEKINSSCIDLIYLDPPFNKNKKFVAPTGSSADSAEFSDIFREIDVKIEWLKTIKQDESDLYEFLMATRGIGNNTYTFCYLCYMAIRLIECKRILKPTGSIFLHCDPTMSHYLKVVLDCIFDESANSFKNEIVWCYTGPSNTKKWFPRKHDVILWYGRPNNKIFNIDKIRIPYRSLNTQHSKKSKKTTGIGGKLTTENVQKYRDKGKIPEDWWEENRDGMSPVGRIKKERTGYPTQKPSALLERIIKVASNKGALILDPFCGCATTCVAAEKLNRKWIGIDISHKAYELVQGRFEDELGLFGTGFNYKTAPPKRTDEGAKYKIQKYVYVISNPQYKGEFKVGVASNVSKRLGSYQTSDPNRGYKKEFSLLTPYFNQIESKIHEDFDNQHEWVKGDLEEIIKAIKSLHRKGNRGSLL